MASVTDCATVCQVQGAVLGHRAAPQLAFTLSPKPKVCRARKLSSSLLALYPCRGSASLLRLFTELRQACCHPQIVRRNDNVLGNERLGMSDIMRKLSQKAYLEYDSALRTYMQACLVKAAALTKPSDLPSEASLHVWQCPSTPAAGRPWFKLLLMFHAANIDEFVHC